MNEFWIRWLTIWCWAVIGLGAMLALSAIEALRVPTLLFLDLVFWPLDGKPSTLDATAVFTTGLTGALTAGWGVLMLCLVRDPALNRNPRIWRHITTGAIVWFVSDSLVSVVSGASVNAISNTAILAAYLVPVLKSGALSDRPAPARSPD